MCRRGQVVQGVGLALLRTFARDARVLDLATAHTGTGRLRIGVVNELPPSFGGVECKAATERR